MSDARNVEPGSTTPGSTTHGSTTHGSVERAEVEAVLETRRELGAEYEPALVDAFAERVEQAVEARVQARLAARGADEARRNAVDRGQLTLGIVSLGTGIPITAIAGGIADLPGLVVAWIGIVGVNAAHAWRRRPGRS